MLEEIMGNNWEYKIVDLSNSTSMGFSNPETEEFKANHKNVDWKLEMRNIVLNKYGSDGWELVSIDPDSSVYFKRQL